MGRDEAPLSTLEGFGGSSRTAAQNPEARRQLLSEAASLDVEDIVDLCCAPMGDKRHDPTRVAIYLEALRQKSGEKAQLGACLLCFDLARHGDASRDVEVHLLLPVIAALAADDPRSLVQSLTEKSEAVLNLWTDLYALALNRDTRSVSLVPELDDDFEVEVSDFFSDEDMADIGAVIDDLAGDTNDHDERFLAFDAAVNRHWSPGTLLFSAETGADVDRLERVQEAAQSFAASVPVARQMQAVTGLFLATHTRALGLFGRRNKRRDAALKDALLTFCHLDAPPGDVAAWFVPGGDVVGAVPHAWEKMAEVLIDFAGFVGNACEGGAGAVNLDELVASYVADARSARVPPVLAAPGQRRRR